MVQNMKITIIKVAMFEGKAHDALKPLVFEIIAQLTPANTIVEFIDDRKQKLPKFIESEVIILSFDTFSAKRAYFLSAKFKKPTNLMVLAGIHPTICPEEAAEHGDTLLLGDAESTYLEFINDYQKGQVKSIYDGRLNEAALISLANSNKSPYQCRYLPLGLVQFSRGCKYACDFCSVKTMYPNRIRSKNIMQITAEIAAQKEKFIFFIDDNLLTNTTQAEQLFLALKPLKKRWACQISLDIALNTQLLALMAASGCICVLIGFESLNKQNLENMSKKANLLIEDYQQAITNLHVHKILVYGTFIIGYDQDDHLTAAELVNFACLNNLAVANFNPLIPLPKTPLYLRLKQQNRLIDDGIWWLNPNYHYGDTAFLPAKMSGEQLQLSCQKARYSFYSFKSIIKRGQFIICNFGLMRYSYFLMINIISAREIRRKQGALLGE